MCPRLGLGVDLPVRKGGFSVEYNAVYNSMTNKPTDDIAAAQDTMVRALVSGGVWSKMDLFYLFAQYSNDDGEALKNWINPGTNDATAVNSPTFTSLEGFTGDGSTSYLDSNYNPSTHGVNVALNDFNAGVYARLNLLENTYLFGHMDSNSNSDLRLSTSFDVAGTKYIITRHYGGNGMTVTNTDSRGMYSINRTGANAIEVFKNGESKGTDTDASVGLRNTNVLMLAYENGGGISGYTNNQISFFFMSKAFNETNNGVIYDAIQAYMTFNGKQV